MATFYSTQMTPPVYPVSGPIGDGRTEQAATGNYTYSATMAVADKIVMLRLHKNFRVTGGYFKTSGLGTSVTAIVGDAADDDRYFTSASVAAAGTNTTMADTGRGYNNPAFTNVIVTLAGATTNASGTIELILFGIIENPL